MRAYESGERRAKNVPGGNAVLNKKKKGAEKEKKRKKRSPRRVEKFSGLNKIYPSYADPVIISASRRDCELREMQSEPCGLSL